MERAAFSTEINGLPYRVVALKFSDGNNVLSVHVERKGKWARLNEHTQRHAHAEAIGSVSDKVEEFFAAH